MELQGNIFIRFLDNSLYDINVSDFEVNLALTDIKNLNAAKSSFSLPISLPYTPQVTQVFGSLFNVNNPTDIVRMKIPAKLIYNNRTIVDGYCYVETLDTDVINVIIARGDLTIFEDVIGLYLSDLLLTGASYTYNNKEWVDYYNDFNTFTYSGDTCDINHTHKFVAIDWFGMGNKLDNFKTYYNFNALMSSRYRLSPVLRVKYLFDMILTDNGYTYSMSAKTQQKLESLYMSTNVPISNYTTDAESWYFFSITKFTDNIGTNPTNNVYLNPYEQAGSSKSWNKVSTETHYTTTHNYGLKGIYPFILGNTQYTFNMQVQAYNPGAGQSNTLKYYLHRAFPIGAIYDADPKNENEILIAEFTISGTSVYDVYYSEKTYTPTNAEIFSKTLTGNTYGYFFDSFYIRVENDGNTTNIGQFLRIKCPNWLYDVDHTYTLNDLLPTAYKQTDFLNDIFTLFNTYIYVDKDNKSHLNLLTYDDFYTNEVLDWTSKLSLDKIEISDVSKELSNKYIFSFKEGEDLINKAYQDKNKRILNEQDLYNDNPISKVNTENISTFVTQNTFTTELIRSDSFHFGISSMYTNESTKLAFGYINRLGFGDWTVGAQFTKNYEETVWDYNTYQPILYSINQYLTLSPYMITGNTYYYYTMPIADPNTFCLQFNTEEQYLINYDPNTNQVTNNNLYTQFWMNEIDSKINGNSKMLRTQMKLVPDDIDILNFRKRIWIDNPRLGGSYYHINKIVFPSNVNKLAKVELISVTNYAPSTTSTVNLHRLNYNPLTDATGSYGGSSSTQGGGSSSSGTQGGSTPVGSFTISGATDANIQYPTENDILTYKSSKWVNSDTVKTKAIYGNSGTTLFIAPDSNRVQIGPGSYSNGRILNVFGGVFSDGNLEFSANRSVYMGSTDDTGPRFNWKQISTAGVDQGSYQDYYPYFTLRTGAVNSGTKTVIYDSLGAANFQHNVSISGDSTHAQNLGSPVFFSGFDGTGWRLDNNGDISLTLDNITVRKQMKVFELQIQKISSVNGGLIISCANGKAYSVGTNKIYFDENGVKNQIQFAIGDYIRAQMWLSDGISYYLGHVTGVHHSATLGSAYIDVTDVTNTCWEGAELVQVGSDTQAGRRNVIMITAAPDDNYNPYMAFHAGITNGTFNQTGTLKVKIGNLNGVSDPDFGGTLSGFGLYATGNVYLKGIMQIAPGSTGFTNLSDLPGTLKSPSGTGLFLSANYMGFYDSGVFKTYMANNGDFGLGDTSLTGPGLFWDQSAGLLSIKGAINITNTISYGSVTGGPPTNADHTASNTAAGIAGQGSLATQSSIDYTGVQLTNKPTIPTNTNQLTDGANLGGTAVWTGISSKPTGAASLITTPAGAGLWIDGTHMGYYDGGNWTAVISNDGSATFKGVIEFGTAATTGPWSSAQNLALIGSDIYEGMCHTSDAAIHINRLGYHGSQYAGYVDGYYNYPRATYIHQNSDTAIAQFESGGITFNKNVGITNVASFGNSYDATDRSTILYGQFVRGNYITMYGTISTPSYIMETNTGGYARMIRGSSTTYNQALYLPGAADGMTVPVGTQVMITNSQATYSINIVAKRTDSPYTGYKIMNAGSELTDLQITPGHNCMLTFDGVFWHLLYR